eukprot:12665480-Alexandrium_andersonii.AAC.1
MSRRGAAHRRLRRWPPARRPETPENHQPRQSVRMGKLQPFDFPSLAAPPQLPSRTQGRAGGNRIT